MLNRIVLGLNLLALFVAVGERSNFNDGSLAWLASLPWFSFATEIWAITAAPTVSSDALLAAWLFITGLWALVTVSAWVLGRKKAEHQSSLQSTSLGASLASAPADPRVDPALRQGLSEGTNEASNSSSTKDKGSTPGHDIPDPALGSLFDDLSRQVDAFTPEARAELAKVKNALAALAQKDSSAPNS
ncbi:MAG: hypothetical protein ACO3TB_00255 [Burkholderiaceae bacterium]|jgi:hypothetical protein